MLLRLLERLRLRLWLREEHESLALRRHFSRRFSVEVGLYSYGCFDRWRIPARTRIGRYCSFAKSVRVLDANHPMDGLTTHPFLYEAKWGVVEKDRIDPEWLVIEDDVWVGHNAIITPGCKFIGRGSIIGAAAVVTRDVPAYSIVVGMPGKLLRKRFDNATIDALEASRWWELDKAGLKALVSADSDLAFHPTAARLASLGP